MERRGRRFLFIFLYFFLFFSFSFLPSFNLIFDLLCSCECQTLWKKKLYDATAGGRVSEVSSLLRNHPEIDVNWTNPDNYQWTPLHAASRYGHVEVVKLLLAHPDINVNLKSRGGQTPLSLGCKYGQVSVVEVLLKDRHVNVTLNDKEGCTPLWWASCIGNHGVIEWLVASGRDLGDISNKKGNWNGKEYAALDIARERNKTEVVSLLERFMANPTLTRREIRKKLNFTGLSLFPFHFIFVFIFIFGSVCLIFHFSFVNKIETSLERFLGVQGGLSVCASSVPLTFTDPAEVTFLSLADCSTLCQRKLV